LKKKNKTVYKKRRVVDIACLVFENIGATRSCLLCGAGKLQNNQKEITINKTSFL
jgi:hypothetical protein